MKIGVIKLIFIVSLFFGIFSSSFPNENLLRVITINVWSGLDYEGYFRYGEYESTERRELRFQSLLSQVRALDPDIIFIQEANHIESYSARLADSLNYDEIHQVRNAGIKFGTVGVPVNFKEGITLLAKKKFKLQKYDLWKLSGSFGLYGDLLTIHFDETNFALVGKIFIDESLIYLINIHLTSAAPKDSAIYHICKNLHSNHYFTNKEFEEVVRLWNKKGNRREYEVENLLTEIGKLPKNVPIIVAGDFNAISNSPEIEKLKNSGGFIDVFVKENNGFTWHPSENENIIYSTKFTNASGDSLSPYDRVIAVYDTIPRRIDYIFLSNHFKKENIIDTRVVCDSVIAGIHTSDHYGVMTELDMEELIRVSPKESNYITKLNESTIEPLPILSYDTDIGFGYGVKSFFLNYFDLNESFDIVLFNSTKGERWYRFVFSIPDFEIRQGKIYPLSFDLIVDYDKWIKNSFFGIGNNSSYDDREYYTREPLEISSVFSRGFTQHIVGQLGTKYKTIRNFNFSDSSRLVNLSPPLNSSKVKYASIFLNFRYDSRNSFINPTDGLVLQAEAEYVPHIGINNVNFTRLGFTFQYYNVLFYPTTVFALRLNYQEIMGNNLPVQVLSSIGGNNNLRGSPQDRYLDKTSAIVNTELRFPIYWRFGGILGYDLGKVWSSSKKIDITRWSSNPTFGLRFYMETFVVRMDIGFGKETTGFYFNFGHIF